VSATRGREANTIYVDTCVDPDAETNHDARMHVSADQILRTVLDKRGCGVSAHETIDEEINRVGKLRDLVQQLEPAHNPALDPIHFPRPKSDGFTTHELDRPMTLGHAR
jgi:hypothetical protein